MGLSEKFKQFVLGKKSKSDVNFIKLKALCEQMLDGSNENFNDSLVAQICKKLQYVIDNRGTQNTIKYEQSHTNYEWAQQAIQLLEYEYNRFNKKANKLLSSGLSAEQLATGRKLKAAVDKKHFKYNYIIEPVYLNCTTIDIPTTPDNGRDAK